MNGLYGSGNGQPPPISTIPGSGIGPHYKNYQLLGDSNLLRFTVQVSGSRVEKEWFLSKKEVRHSGFCVSGQSVDQLLRRVKEGSHLIGSQVLVMIGTNSVRRRISLKNVIDRFKKLVKVLKNIGVKKLTLCSILPLPKYKKRRIVWDRIIAFNRVVKWTAKRFACGFLNVFGHFAVRDSTIKPSHPNWHCIRTKFFQRWYGKKRLIREKRGKLAQRKITDLIHLNAKGITELQRLFDSSLP